jgi:phosphoribosyl-ATP pyrophosphohydrolase
MSGNDTLSRLESTIAARRSADPSESYVAKLHQKGLGEIAQKLGEESVETVIAALTGNRKELVGEAADVLFHLIVLLNAKDVPLSEVLAELDRREGVSGIAEKASRNRSPKPTKRTNEYLSFLETSSSDALVLDEPDDRNVQNSNQPIRHKSGLIQRRKNPVKPPKFGRDF